MIRARQDASVPNRRFGAGIMANYERGAYEPSDDVHVFDGAEDEDDEEGSRLPLLIVMALIVLAAFGGVVWLAYERGVASGRTEPRILTAEQGPAKVAPAGQAGSESPYKGLKIYEQPAPSDEDADTGAAPAAPPRPAASPLASVPSATTAAKLPPVEMQAAAKPVTAAKPPTPKPTETKPAVTAAAEPPAVAKPPAMTVAAPAAPVAKPKPVADTASLPAVPAKAAASAESPAVAPAAAHTASGSYVLQIGAYKSQAEAEQSWRAFQAKHAALMSGFSSDVKQVDLGDKGTWYRLRVGSFADKDAATAICEKLKAEGGNCFLAR